MKTMFVFWILPFVISLTAVDAQLKEAMIRHTVVFKLKHTKGSPEELNFMAAASKLAQIPGVVKFESLKQTSKKNNYDYGLSMEFANQHDYDQYSNHPEHTAFVKKYWGEVAEFLEIDYGALK